MGTTASKRIITEEWYQLPKDLKCETVRFLTDIKDIQWFMSKTGDKALAYQCVRLIESDNPDETISPEFILHFKNLEEVRIPIMVTKIEQLDQLAASSILSYNIILSGSIRFGQPQLIHFIKVLCQYKDLNQVRFVITPQWVYKNEHADETSKVLANRAIPLPPSPSTIKDYSESYWVKYKYNRGRFTLAPFMFETAYILYEIIRDLSIKGELKALELYGNCLHTPQMRTRFTELITELEIEEIGIRGSHLDYYYSLLNIIDRLYLAPYFFLEHTENILYNMTYASFNFLSTNLILGNKRKIKIELPQFKESLSVIFRLFPNIIHVGLIDTFPTLTLFYPNYQPITSDQIIDFFEDHPGMALTFYTSHPKQFIQLQDLYPLTIVQIP